MPTPVRPCRQRRGWSRQLQQEGDRLGLKFWAQVHNTVEQVDKQAPSLPRPPTILPVGTKAPSVPSPAVTDPRGPRAPGGW